MAHPLGKNLKEIVLVFTCQDTHGIIAKVTGFLSSVGAFICELSEFGDPLTQRFFLRCHFQLDATVAALNEKFSSVASFFNASWQFHELSRAPKTVLLVSKFSHCLNDILYRAHNRRLNIDIRAVISNHDDLKEMTQHYGIPFHYFPIAEGKKAEQEAAVRGFLEEHQIELVILARYMQVLSPAISGQFFGKIINIHHSFLPSFKGAKPYHQAFERGVKIIGASAHYVTEQLDEGPIIEQEVMRVDHVKSVEDMISIGFDIEVEVLARAIKYHVQHRVFINGNKTVIFK